MITIQLSVGEVRLIAEALHHRANRHEAEGRARPGNAGPHDRRADEMRKLCERILQARAQGETRRETVERVIGELIENKEWTKL